MKNQSIAQSNSPLHLWLGYVMFVVYGSLVPLDFKAIPWDQAWAAFQNIPFLKLGVASRADWIANGVLYVPVSFLTAYLLAQTFHRTPRLLLWGLAGAFSVALAIGVEFTQLFFPQRTVSLNDILAECAGSLVGLALSARYVSWFQTLLHFFLSDSQRLRMLEGYALAYLAFVFFPFDILLSWPELEAKLHSGDWGWFLADRSSRLMILALQFVAEVALTAPFGVLLARLMGPGLATYLRVALMGLLLGSTIEFGQFFLFSGSSQGLSVLSRVLGVCGGLALYKHRAFWTPDYIALNVKRFTFVLCGLYLIALLAINGWFLSSWTGLGPATVKLNQVRFIPFYYHYFTSENKALFSLLTVCLSYLPVAVLAWANRTSLGRTYLIALALASVVEAGKLFLPGSHPDPSNILLSCFVTWLAMRFLNQSAITGGENLPKTAGISTKTFPLWLLCCLAAMGLWAATFPAFPALLLAALVACGVSVWYRPMLIFAIIPAALPVFDLAPWSGRFFFDEFDALLLVGLAVAYARAPVLPLGRRRALSPLVVAAGLLGLSLAISAVRGMLPFHWPDANSFNTYYSPYNALRIVKGAVWAWLAYRLSNRFFAAGIEVRRPFAWGMVVGLGLTVAVILWERIAFSGLWNFSADYRVTGPFSAMHTGGAYIECFLAVATPFLLVLMAEQRPLWVRLAGAALLLTTTYALMVTFSRNGYSAFAIAVVITLLVVLLKSKRRLRIGIGLGGVVGAMLLVALPVFQGDFAQSRMATVGADLGVRQAHWKDALDIRDSDWATSLFGMGVGRFPETSYWRSAVNPRSGTYQLEHESGNTFLRLGAGDSIYLEQLVQVAAGQEYVLTMDVRPHAPNTSITVPICEKWMLTAYNCLWQSTNLGPQFGAWRTVKMPLNAEGFSTSPWYSKRSIKLALYYSTPMAPIDIDNVRLESATGVSLLPNGDFSQGLDHWFFSTDGHLQWHAKSLPYGVLFDQGWFGLAAFALFLLLVLGRGTRSAWVGDAMSGAALAALSSFLVVGLFDTLIDSPRFLLLLFLLALVQSAPRPKLQHPRFGQAPKHLTP